MRFSVWPSARSSILTLSHQLWQNAFLSLVSSVLGIGKSRREPNLVNKVVEAWLGCCFWPKNHEQALMCELVHYRDAESMIFFPQFRSFEPYCFTQTLHNFLVVFLINRTTCWQELMMHHAIVIEENSDKPSYLIELGVLFSVLAHLAASIGMIGPWFRRHNHIPTFRHQL